MMKLITLVTVLITSALIKIKVAVAALTPIAIHQALQLQETQDVAQPVKIVAMLQLKGVDLLVNHATTPAMHHAGIESRKQQYSNVKQRHNL